MQHRAEITDGKYLREAIYGLKEPTQEETVEIIRMSEANTQTVEWLYDLFFIIFVIHCAKTILWRREVNYLSPLRSLHTDHIFSHSAARSTWKHRI